MKFPAFILAAVLACGGCVTHGPAPTAAQISGQRDQVLALRDELDVKILQLGHTERDLVSLGKYPVQDQSRDLNRLISILQSTNRKLSAEDQRLHREYHLSYGTY